jgi:hypothetical protein
MAGTTATEDGPKQGSHTVYLVREAMTHGPSIMAAMDRAEPLADPARACKRGTIMRTLRLSLAGMVMLALLGGLGGVALAQADTEGAKVTHVTGTRVSAVEGTIDEWWEADGIGHGRGLHATETIEWSDARLPSELQMVQNVDALGREAVVTGATLLEGPEGYWTGEFTAYCDPDSDCHGMNTITGHGAYEGLFAVFRGFWADGPGSDWVFDGVIYEGETLPMPEALEPTVAATAATGEVMVESHESEDAAVEATEQPEAPADGDGDLSGTAVYTDGLRTWQYWEGDDTIYELEMSDPRANGTYTEWGATIVGNGYDGDSLRPSLVGLMEVTLASDEGTWTGVQSAVWDDDMGWRLTAWLAGEDAYEGLSLYLHAHRFPVYSTPEMEFDGIIFDGEPPVMLEAVSFPAE